MAKYNEKLKRLCSLGQMPLCVETAQGHLQAVILVEPHLLRGGILKTRARKPLFFSMQAALLGRRKPGGHARENQQQAHSQYLQRHELHHAGVDIFQIPLWHHPLEEVCR